MSREATAVHEAGHAIAMFCRGCRPKSIDLYMEVEEDGEEDWCGAVEPALAMDELTRYVVGVAGGLAEMKYAPGVEFDPDDPMDWLADRALRWKPDDEIDGPCGIISAGQRTREQVYFESGDLDAAAARGPLKPDLLRTAIEVVRRLWNNPAEWQRVRELAETILARLGNSDKTRLKFDDKGHLLKP